MEEATNSLNSTNYSKGFLIDEEWIGGVTEMDGGLFSAYVSHYLTGETLVYQEFTDLELALSHLNAIPKNWKFEGVGCSAKTKPESSKKTTSTGCSTSGCNACQCK